MGRYPGKDEFSATAYRERVLKALVAEDIRSIYDAIGWPYPDNVVDGRGVLVTNWDRTIENAVMLKLHINLRYGKEP